MFRKGALTGLLLFGLFFGAGNLIFPPTIGVLSGANFIPAVAGFVVSAVGIATFTLVVSLFTGKGYQELISELVHPNFALLFLVALYLTIGPLFAIPRTATTSFSIGVEPLLSGEYKTMGLAIFALLYFVLTYWLSVTPSKLLDRIGKVLTPLFAGMIILVVVLGLIQLPNMTMNTASSGYLTVGQAFGSGLLEGYNTLDALAAVAFSVVAMNTLKTVGFHSRKELNQTVLVSGVSVAALFSILYLGLALLGNHFTMPSNFTGNVGTYILSEMTQRVFGQPAQLFLAIMVIVTCMTTTVGLVVSISGFFQHILPQFAYTFYVRIFCVLGVIIANFGLSTIITLAVPVLVLLCPLAIVLAIFVCLHQLMKLSKLGICLTVGGVVVVGLLQALTNFNEFAFIKNVLSLVPFNDAGMPWLLPALIGVVLAIILPYGVVEKFKYIGEYK